LFKFDFVDLEVLSIAQSLCNVRFDDVHFETLFRVGPDVHGMGEDILLGHTYTQTSQYEGPD
jgi:hypothetical protein